MRREILILVVLMLLSGCYSVFLGQNTHWDLLNYHLYNGFAFLHGRLGTDVFPAALHTTFNPIWDAVYYLIFTWFFEWPRLMAFVQGLPYGVLVWLSYRMMMEVFRDAPKEYRMVMVLCATLIGCTSAGIFPQLGGSTAEVYITIFKIGSLWLAVRFIRKPVATHLIYWSAFLMGVAAGFKVSAAHACLALAVLFLYQWKLLKNPWKSFCYFALAGLAGFLLVDGYFMWLRWHLYRNPFFPLLNNVFKSPYMDPISLVDARLKPTNWLMWFFFPFYWVIKPVSGLAMEPRFADPRWAICFIALPLLYFRKLKTKCNTLVQSHLFNSLVVFAVSGYVFWLFFYSILRYAGALEILSGVFIVAFFSSIGKKWWGMIFNVSIAQWLLWFTTYPNWGHLPYTYHAFKPIEAPERLSDARLRKLNSQPELWEKYKQMEKNKQPKPVSLPHIEDNSLVFTMVVGSSFLLPLLNPKAQFIGGYKHKMADYPLFYLGRALDMNYSFTQDFFAHHFEDLQRKKIAEHTGPIYILSFDWPMIVHDPVMRKFGLKGKWEDCTPIKMQMYPASFALCKVTKITSKDQAAVSNKKGKKKST